MLHAAEIIATHPQVQGNLNATLAHAVDQCYACSETCTVCADACLGEQQVQSLIQCIRLNLDCADLCIATGRLASRRTGSNPDVIRAALKSCVDVCSLCAEECERHESMHEHCRICAEACRDCEQACNEAAQGVH